MHLRPRSLLCLLLLLPLLAAGAQAAADPLAGLTPPVQAQPKACCAAMAAASGACPGDAPCRVSSDPRPPAPEAALIVPAWPQAPAPLTGPPVALRAAVHPAGLAAALLTDPPPQERYLRLAVLRI